MKRMRRLGRTNLLRFGPAGRLIDAVVAHRRELPFRLTRLKLGQSAFLQALVDHEIEPQTADDRDEGGVGGD